MDFIGVVDPFILIFWRARQPANPLGPLESFGLQVLAHWEGALGSTSTSAPVTQFMDSMVMLFLDLQATTNDSAEMSCEHMCVIFRVLTQ